MYEHDRSKPPGPLAGTRVVDLTSARAGPTCVRQLTDLGADAIQVRAPDGFQLHGSDAENLHRGKRSIVLDLKADGGRDVLLRLVERADVLVENFRPAVKHRLRIDPDTLLELNPRLVYGSISAFGQTGPYAERPGYDQIAQGLAGLMSVTGPPGSGPWRAGIAIADSAAGTFLAQGILAGLVARASSGRGQWVHTSLLEALVNLMDFQAERWLVERDVPGQAGNDHPSIPGSGTFRTADGYVNVVAIAATDRFYAALGRPDLADDERVANASNARERRDAVYAACDEIFRERSSAEWVELLNDADIACGPVLTMDEVFADPQVRHLELTRAVAHPTAGALELLRLPLTFSDATVDVGHAAPAPGAHTREVLAEHGYSEPEVAELLGRGVVRQAG